MYSFDLQNEPPTTRELETIADELKSRRRQLVKKSCIADGIHGLILLILYFGDFLSGGALVVTLILSLIVAVVLATATREKLYLSDLLAIAVTSVGTVGGVVAILTVGMSQPLGAATVAGLTAGSIVVSGTRLGRELKKVMVAIEELKPVLADDEACQAVQLLCQCYPELQQYRQQAAQNLRPHLTYGELAAMQRWHDRHQN